MRRNKFLAVVSTSLVFCVTISMLVSHVGCGEPAPSQPDAKGEIQDYKDKMRELKGAKKGQAPAVPPHKMPR